METRLTDDTPGFKSAIRKRLLQQKSICPKAQTAPAATDWCLEVSCRMSGRICAGSGCHVIYGPCNRISSRLLAHPDAARSQKCHHSDTDDFTQCLMNWWRHCAVPTDDDGCSWHMCYDVMTMDHATVGSVGIDAYKLSILTRKCYIHGCSARIDAFSFKTVTYNEQNKPCHIIWFLFRYIRFALLVRIFLDLKYFLHPPAERLGTLEIWLCSKTCTYMPFLLHNA